MIQIALHVAVIPDGNGRWAQARQRQRPHGHRAGATAVRRTVECAPGLGIGMLTLYAFSSDNWHRPASEVGGLMRLFEQYLRGETARCVAEGVRVRVIGRRDRLAKRLVRALMATHGIHAENVIGHWEAQEMAGIPADQRKSCPGRLFDMAAFRRILNENS